MLDITASDRLAVKNFATKTPVFVCVISYTATSEISGLTVAGANAELMKYTSPADAEFLYHGRCSCIKVVPATPDGKPTPALITRTALQLARIPLLVVDAGAKVKPSIPYISFGVEPGRNIINENAMDISSVKRAFAHGELLGKQLAIMSDLIVVGESIPGGTTTALAVLRAIGIDARFKVSSSMPENPHNLKNKVVDSAIERVTAGRIERISSPFDAISTFGVPILSCDLHLGESSKAGLQAFAKGFVKEGVGAGGASIVAITKSRGKITGKKLMNAIEKEYEISIEAVPH